MAADLIVTPLKRCTKCKKTFPPTTEYFYRHKGRSDGLTSRCKSCTKEDVYSLRNEDRETANEKRRAWVRANPDRIRGYNRSTHAKHRDQHLKQMRVWYINNRDRKLAADSARYRTNREVECQKRQRWYKANKEHISERNRLWRLLNPEQVRANNQLRRARKLGAVGHYAARDVKLQYKAQKGRCWWCGKKVGNTYHVDHRVPLVQGGTNNPDNICISCPQCNMSKGGKLPWEWNGRLL